jgi:hypothetical protein
MSVLTFWVVTSCGIIGKHQRNHLPDKGDNTYPLNLDICVHVNMALLTHALCGPRDLHVTF